MRWFWSIVCNMMSFKTLSRYLPTWVPNYYCKKIVKIDTYRYLPNVVQLGERINCPKIMCTRWVHKVGTHVLLLVFLNVINCFWIHIPTTHPCKIIIDSCKQISVWEILNINLWKYLTKMVVTYFQRGFIGKREHFFYQEECTIK